MDSNISQRWIIGFAICILFLSRHGTAQSAKERAANQLFEEGVHLLSSGKNAEAAESFELVIRISDSLEARALLGLAYAREGKCDTARDMAFGVEPELVRPEYKQLVTDSINEVKERCPIPSATQETPLYVGKAKDSRPMVDPGDDRVMTQPSAQTLAKGTFSFTDYEIGMVHFSWVPLDGLQVSLAFTVPVLQVSFVPSIKWRFLDHPSLKMAAIAGGGAGVFYAGPDQFIVGGGGALVADVCLKDDCRSFMSFSSQAGFVKLGGARHGDADFVDGWGWGVFSGIGAVVEVHRKVKLLFELKHSIIRSETDWSDTGSLFTFVYGIRVHGDEFGADIGFMRPFLLLDGSEPEHVEDFMKYLPIGYPWLAFTYQW